MTNKARLLCAALASVILAGPAMAQHRVDCILSLGPDPNGPAGQQRILTGFFVGATDPVATPQRVFASTLGDVAPDFTDTPGFDCVPGTFPYPSSNGFTILKTLRRWNGDGFDVLHLPQDEHIQVTYGPLGPVQSPDCDTPVSGFTVSVGSNGEWHRHLQYTLTNAARTGVYLLKMNIFSTNPSISTSKPIWFVFQQANITDDPPADPSALLAQQQAAIDWVNLHLVPQLCDADYDADGVLSVQDIFAYLNAWFAGSPDADFNGNCTLEVQDIFDFLNAWFAGCPS